MLSNSFDPTFSFGSEAANLEYSILSAILGNPSPPDSATSPPGPSSSHYSSWPATDPMDFSQSPRLGTMSANYSSSYGDPSMSIQPSDTTLTTSPSSSAHYITYPYTQQRSDDLVELQYPPSYTSPQLQHQLHPLAPRYPLDNRPRSPPTSVYLHNASSKDGSSRNLLSPPPPNSSPASTESLPAGLSDSTALRVPSNGSQLQNINDRVTTPYDYTEGYHFLMKHLPSRCVCH